MFVEFSFQTVKRITCIFYNRDSILTDSLQNFYLLLELSTRQAQDCPIVHLLDIVICDMSISYQSSNDDDRKLKMI